MAEQKKINAKVIGKWIKGVFWKRPQISVEFKDNISPKHYDFPVSMALWNALEKGMEVTVKMEFDRDCGLWFLK